MPKLREYACACGNSFEYLHMNEADIACCAICGNTMSTDDEKLGGKSFHVIVPTHRTSKKIKAGYVHSHGDRPAEKGSVSVPRNKGDLS